VSLLLFEAYPALRAQAPHVVLASLPTPVAPLPLPEAAGGAVYVKRDDLSAAPYGGNKVRKLEFLLGSAVACGAGAVLTFGAAGSNHALATAIYARQLGLRAISMLVPQPNARSVRRNLLRGHLAGARLLHYSGRSRVALGTLAQFRRERREHGQFPHVFPPGGSSPEGCLGFVNAAFELRAQVDAGLLPAPDRVYVASGTMGTCIGLLIGLGAAGLPAEVVAVRVTDPPYTSPAKARRLYDATKKYLRRAVPDFPDTPFPEDPFTLRHEFLGERYGVHTEAGRAAVARARALGLELEGTYTGKAFAALLADAAAGDLRGRTALFWNTYNSHDFSAEIGGMDYRALPKDLHPYFEDAVQDP